MGEEITLPFPTCYRVAVGCATFDYFANERSGDEEQTLKTKTQKTELCVRIRHNRVG